MIDEYELKNFKIHEKLNLHIGNLTVFTGMNGMGKSSVFQSMLLLRQSFFRNDSSQNLNLRGNLIESCSSGELICQSSGSDKLSVVITNDDETKLNFCYSYVLENPNATMLKGMRGNSSKGKCRSHSLFNENFQYIAANRFGPKQKYDLDSYVVEDCRQISDKTGQCELVAHFLHRFGNERIPIKDLACLNSKIEYGVYKESLDDDLSLKCQVRNWLQYISPGINIEIKPNDKDLKLEYKYDVVDESMTKNIPATQAGYGITYCLPIIVAVLNAKPGSLLLIENPEAHIHPQGQAKLMELITKAADKGIQIIIETHSDHIVNGALVAVAKKRLPCQKLSMYYFGRKRFSHVSNVVKLNVLKSGKIRNPPEGFFDQIELDMKQILGF
ncbi:MAG: DUF3696 domain-containing protein [Fibrobacter sp.]|nr:DUF3696 domain-containing protein [Fibrobacter sp.]